MPRQAQKQQTINAFSAGLITETNPVAGTPNAASSIDNVDLLRDGSARRRRGLNLETGGGLSLDTFASADLGTQAITFHEWKSVNGDDSLNFSVVQVGGILYFYDLGADIISSNIIGFLSLAPIRIDDTYTQFPIDADTGKGQLFIVGQKISPAYLKYDADMNQFNGVKLTLKIRDFEGLLDDNTAPVIEFGNETPVEETDPDDDINDIADPVGIEDPEFVFTFEEQTGEFVYGAGF